MEAIPRFICSIAWMLVIISSSDAASTRLLLTLKDPFSDGMVNSSFFNRTSFENKHRQLEGTFTTRDCCLFKQG